MSRHPMYFIALVLPPPLAAMVRQWQREMADRYGSRHALRSPPHITLYRPFRPDAAAEKAMGGVMRHVAARHAPVHITLDRFDHFSRRVLYAHVGDDAAMETLHRAVTDSLEHAGVVAPEGGDRRPFRPHVTLAHRDLTPEAFERAWPAFGGRTLHETGTVDAVSLLRHGPGGWTVTDTFPLEAQP